MSFEEVLGLLGRYNVVWDILYIWCDKSGYTNSAGFFQDAVKFTVGQPTPRAQI